MFYLRNICFLCLNYIKNVISQAQYSTMRKELEYIIPAHILRISNIPKNVCDVCMESLKMFCIFKKKCIDSVTIFNKYFQKLTQGSESYQCLSVTLTDILYQNNSKVLNQEDNCALSTKNITENKDYVERTSYGDLFSEKDINEEIITVLEGDVENFLETTNSVQKEHSYSKNYKFFNEEHILKLDIDPIKTDSTFECESCELDFTTEEKLDDHTFWCKKKNKSDGINYLNINSKEEVLEIDNYENYQTSIQQNENIEQDPLTIEDTLEKFEIKKEIDDEIIIKQEKFDTDDFNTDTTKTGKELKQFVENPGFEQVTIKIEDTLEGVEKEIYEEIIIKNAKSDTNGDIFECETCELAFDTNMKLISHTSCCKKNKSSIETANQIQNDCTSSIKSGSINISTDSKKKLKPCVKLYGCDVCNKAYYAKGNLKRHKRIHTGDTPHECDVCKKSFVYLSKLQEHKLMHTGKKPFPCDVCGSSFRSKSHLINHKLIHTGEKPFLCDVCRISFRSRHHLANHKLIHTGEKPFTCDVCRSSFRTKTHLSNHKLIHTGEKSFSCDVCKKKYFLKSTLRQHKLLYCRKTIQMYCL